MRNGLKTTHRIHLGVLEREFPYVASHDTGKALPLCIAVFMWRWMVKEIDGRYVPRPWKYARYDVNLAFTYCRTLTWKCCEHLQAALSQMASGSRKAILR